MPKQFPTIGPPPIRTPLFERPLSDGKAIDLGNITATWVKWLGRLASAVTGGDGGVATAVFFTKTLTANDATLVIPDVIPGSFIGIVIFEDSFGGWVQTWPAEFTGMAGYLQNTTAETYTSAWFYTPDGLIYYLIGAPITGVA